MMRFAIFGATVSLTGATVVVRNNVEDVDAMHEFQSDEKLSTVASMEVVSTLKAIAGSILSPEATAFNTIHPALKAVEAKMDLKTAVSVVDTTSLPRDVTGLVQRVGGNHNLEGFAVKFDEGSLEKARRALNDLIEKAWIELDDKIFKCKGFEDMNRNNYGQVTRDIMRLVEQINNLERMQAEAIAGIAEKTQQIEDTEELLKKETMLYNIEYAQNKAELTIRQNDLDVFQFILRFTKCEDATSLSQTDMRVCQMHSGRQTLFFKDEQVAGKYKQMLTATSKRNIDRILSSVEGGSGISFIQRIDNSTTPPPMVDEPVLGEDGKPCIAATGQVEGNKGDEGVQFGGKQVDSQGGSGMGDEDECMKSCSPDPPKCWLLHDKLSLMWGEYKDKVDELTMEMMKNEYEWMMLRMSLNTQIRILTAAKDRLQQLLAEVRSNLAADRQELKEKEKQKKKLDRQYYAYMDKCFKRIQWIMYQDMCAIKVVRNAVLENSTVCPPAEIQDCDMDSWKKGKCSVPCDDSCDSDQPFRCGGWMTMTRDVIADEDECGIKCPVKSKQIRCGQFKCPVDCLMSEWSGFSKCSAECEGGLKSQTRSVLIKPKNGGKFCDTVQEAVPCNTMSCDRDCTLNRWTEWTPCSVACGGGFQEKFAHVLIPTRGEGKCPKEHSAMRYAKQNCNEQRCLGDEICIAEQDLIVAIDGSGSLDEKGFDNLKTFATTLLNRYHSVYFGQEAVKVGLVLFGNGVILDKPDGSTIVSPARNEHGLSDKIADVITKIEGLPFKKGFTNMAQAFSMAESMFIQGSRKSAQQSVLVVTDGKPSFAWMTNEMVEQLDDKGIMRYFVVVNNQGPTSDVMKQMHRWASQPWETNLIHIQGQAVLEADMVMWAEKALVKFCPLAYSPSTESHYEEVYGYAHVKDSAWCGDFNEDAQMLSTNIEDADQCASLAQGAEAHCFMLGAFFKRGECARCTLTAEEVTDAQYATWQSTKENPECKFGDGWKSSMFWDFYAMEPAAAKDAKIGGR